MIDIGRMYVYSTIATEIEVHILRNNPKDVGPVRD
jgi:hypothetical protein